MNENSSVGKDPKAVERGKKGGRTSSKAKIAAARKNASIPPRPGKRPRGRPPVYIDPALANVFCKTTTFSIEETLKKGTIISFLADGVTKLTCVGAPYESPRVRMALTLLQVREKLLSHGVHGEPVLDAVAPFFKQYAQEVDVIQQLASHKRIPSSYSEVTADHLEFLWNAKASS